MTRFVYLQMSRRRCGFFLFLMGWRRLNHLFVRGIGWYAQLPMLLVLMLLVLMPVVLILLVLILLVFMLVERIGLERNKKNLKHFIRYVLRGSIFLFAIFSSESRSQLPTSTYALLISLILTKPISDRSSRINKKDRQDYRASMHQHFWWKVWRLRYFLP